MTRETGISAVFDCMVYLQAAVSGAGPAGELLRHAERESFSLFTNREILEELRDVLLRPFVTNKYAFVTSEFVEAFLFRISKTSKFIKASRPHFSFPRDPQDEKYINLAVDTKADYVVSRDTDLLDLMTGHADEAKEFRQRFRGLKVVDPVEFLRIIDDRGMSLEP